MAEWLKAHAWKACMLQKGIEGSNPSLSASIYTKIQNLATLTADIQPLIARGRL
jgi:hypothetical protein